MLFDRLCGIVEKPEDLHGPTRGERLPAELIRDLMSIRRVVDDARIFAFPIAPHEMEFRAGVMRENRELLGDRFCLPFRTVAVEDKASCVILQDNIPNAKGLAQPRFFVEVKPAFPDPGNYVEGNAPDSYELLRSSGIPEDAMLVIWGVQLDLHYEDFELPRARVTFQSKGAMMATKKGVYHYTLGEDALEDVRAITENVRIAIEQIAYANMPSRWVVEVLTSQSGQTPAKGRLRRSQQRPQFTTLTPGELRKLFGRESDVDRQSPVVHERRGHWRLYQDERFAKSGLKGLHRWIEATWVGETEAVVGNKKYIVRTDV